MIELSLKISLLSLGFRTITGKNMIFYFMREWLDKKSAYKQRILDEIEKCDEGIEKIKSIDSNEYTSKAIENFIFAKTMLEDHTFKGTNILLYCMKPVILCSTCMASVHSLIWFPILTNEFTFDVVPVMLMVAIMNTFIWSLVEKIQK